MKVGTLVRKTTSFGEVLTGIGIRTEDDSDDWVYVCWGAYGSLWAGVESLEVISESR